MKAHLFRRIFLRIFPAADATLFAAPEAVGMFNFKSGTVCTDGGGLFAPILCLTSSSSLSEDSEMLRSLNDSPEMGDPLFRPLPPD